MDILTRRPLALLPLLALTVAACVPDLDSDEATVSSLRVLALVAEPAEAAPRESVRYRALVADGSGVRSDVPLSWFHCLAQKPLAELGPIHQDCLESASGRLAPVGQGESVQTTIPNDACSLFGPNPPQPKPGEPAGRPADADESGGYRLPVLLGYPGPQGVDVVLHEQRIACGLSGVSPQLSAEFARRYHVNQNPGLVELRVRRAAGESVVVADAATLDVAVGERLELELLWAACPDSDSCGDGVCGPDESRDSCAADCATPKGCAGQERYLDYDRERGELIARRESLRASWYATGGRYLDERTGVSEQAPQSGTANVWSAPGAPGTSTLWVVLRDSRGGVGYRQWSVRAL